MKKLLKSVAARTRAYQPLLRGKCAVLTYHRVLPIILLDPASLSWSMAMSLEAFSAQMRFLKANFDVLTETEFLNWLKERRAPEKHRIAVVTFDDGWRDNFDYAIPVINDLDIPASLFLCTDNVTTGNAFWWSSFERYFFQHGPTRYIQALDRHFGGDAFFAQQKPSGLQKTANVSLPETIGNLKNCSAQSLNSVAAALSAQAPSETREILNWNEVRAIAATGVDIGPHTCSHAILPLLSDEDKSIEVSGSVKELKERGLLTSQFFCFPSGQYDAASLEAVRQAGMSWSYGLGQKAVKPASCAAGAIPRINVGMHNAGDLDGFRWLLARAGAFA